MNISLLSYDTIDSTNTEAIRQAKAGADEGVAVIAGEQTSGRGRHGRTWYSEKDAGLYYSLVLRPTLLPAEFSLITLMAGVAVHDTLESYGLSPDIKWVNDILVHEKKISGILAEATDTPKGPAVILGIGINLKTAALPPEVAAVATSIESETGTAVTPADAAERLSRQIVRFYEILQGRDGAAKIINEWTSRSTYAEGKNVRATCGVRMIEGTTDGLEPNGALRIRTESGELAVVQAGDVVRLRPAIEV